MPPFRGDNRTASEVEIHRGHGHRVQYCRRGGRSATRHSSFKRAGIRHSNRRPVHVALILELCHHVGRHDESVRAGNWAKSPDFCYWLTPQVELAGKQLGLIGYGRIGRQVGAIGAAFGMRVLVSGRVGSSPPPDAESVKWMTAQEVFTSADIVSLHCPLTPDTNRMVNRELLGQMRRTAFLINTSRGGLVNEPDLADALCADQIAGAAVDVVSEEPISVDNPLLSAPNCLITPHMAWSSLAARQRLMRTTAENVAAFLAGRPINVVN